MALGAGVDKTGRTEKDPGGTSSETANKKGASYAARVDRQVAIHQKARHQQLTADEKYKQLPCPQPKHRHQWFN